MAKFIPFLAALGLLVTPFAPAEAAVQRDLSTLDLSKAQHELIKGGPASKVIYSPATGNFGYMFGGGGANYVTENLYLGGAGFGGILGGGFGLGGFQAGYQGGVGERHGYDVSLLLGAGGGEAGPTAVFLPELAYTYNFGGGYRGAVTAGYMATPQQPTLSGVTLGLRLDFKSLSITLPSDD